MQDLPPDLHTDGLSQDPVAFISVPEIKDKSTSGPELVKESWGEIKLFPQEPLSTYDTDSRGDLFSHAERGPDGSSLATPACCLLLRGHVLCQAAPLQLPGDQPLLLPQGSQDGLPTAFPTAEGCLEEGGIHPIHPNARQEGRKKSRTHMTSLSEVHRAGTVWSPGLE